MVDKCIESINFVAKFFDEKILPNIRSHRWNLGIKIARRGAQIYKDQSLSKRDLKLLHTINDYDIDGNIELIMGKSLLVFDESINDAGNIVRVLDKIYPLSRDITVAVPIAKLTPLNWLPSVYLGVNFICGLTVKEETFTSSYNDNIQPYLGCICLPLQCDHPLVAIEFTGNLNDMVLNRILSPYGQLLFDEENNYLQLFEDRYKKSFVFKSECIAKLFPRMSYLDASEDNLKIRIYFRKNYTNTIIFQPMVLLFPLLESGREDDEMRIKNYIIYDFLLLAIVPLLQSEIDMIAMHIIFDRKKRVGYL